MVFRYDYREHIIVPPLLEKGVRGDLNLKKSP